MFTGIVEATATVENIETQGTSVHFTMSCPFTDELKIDQSLSHNGCCLTIEKIENQRYGVTAIQETLEKTNLGSWKIGTKVNLERCVLMNGRLDGHIVLGHVDQTGTIKSIENLNGSHYITIAYTEKDGFTTVPQGSITVDGISLTVAQSGENEFSVAIIPYTWEHTNLKNLEIGSKVNLEFDIIGKYVAKLMKK
jgi:riboflavin synthase, alpha subunit